MILAFFVYAGKACVGLCFYILGTQKVYLKTWGCSHNNSDSEYMAGQLAAYGYNIVGEETLFLSM